MRSLCLVSLFALAACADPAPAKPPPAADTHAKAGSKAGTHDDWCAEHGVAESLCTRCNPSLAAAFQATGDWCAEHGLPESQCVACDPSRKAVRPPKAAP